jgi:hypothetical protein
MMARLAMVITAAVLLGCGSAYAQVGGISISPGPALGITSPLGLGPGSPVGPSGIPMGATELASPGVSPTISGTFPAIGGITTCSDAGGSLPQASSGMGTSMPGNSSDSGMSTGSTSSLFDGGGTSGPGSGTCAGSASTPLPEIPSASSLTGMGAGTSVGRVGIPMGSTEVGVAGLSPPSVALAPNPLANLMTLTPLVATTPSNPSPPLSTSGTTAAPCSPIGFGTGVPSISGVTAPFGAPLTGRAAGAAANNC